jgi:ribosomal-protein-alanine N-acetyltransferase
METDRLTIDRIRESDKEDYFNNISHDKKVLETFICRYAETLGEFDFSPYLANESLFAIRLKETGRLIGIILYFDEKDGACEIGYGIGSRYWNRGYATEAVRRFIEYCFDERGLKTVCASFFTGNEASRRVMEKCGMKFSRFSEKELSYLDIERDLTYYSVSAEDIFSIPSFRSGAPKSG